MSITVRMDKVYGKLMCYPVDDAAKLFSELTGKKTFDSRDLNNIRALGFMIEIEKVSVDKLFSLI